MIARIWHGWTKAADSKGKCLKFSLESRDGALRVIAERSYSIHEDGDEVEFVTLLPFDSMDAVKLLAGEDESRPVIYPKAKSMPLRMDKRSRHYRIVSLH